MTRSQGREVPSLRETEPTVDEFEEEGEARSTEADMWNFTPLEVRIS